VVFVMLWKMNKRNSAIGMADLITGASLCRRLGLYVRRRAQDCGAIMVGGIVVLQKDTVNTSGHGHFQAIIEHDQRNYAA
jgi:hypothetical protein